MRNPRNFDRVSAQIQRDARRTTRLIGCAFVLAGATTAALVYIAVHFLAKVW